MELIRIYRLADMVLHAAAQTFHTLIAGGVRSHRDNGLVLVERIDTQTLCRFISPQILLKMKTTLRLCALGDILPAYGNRLGF